MGDELGSGDARGHRRTVYEAVPGLVYLRRPCAAAGRRPPAASPATTAVLPPEPSQSTRPEKRGDGAAASPTSPTSSTSSVSSRVGMLVGVWLEVVDGRRPVSALRKGPFSPTVAEDLRGRMRDARARPTGATTVDEPSRVLSVHLPPAHRDRLNFTASVLHHRRVRAVAGHLARYDGRWRIESVTLI